MGIFLQAKGIGAVRDSAAGPARAVAWGRLGFAGSLLALLFFGALWTAGGGYAEIHPVLVHSFELVLGAVLGILTGEAAHT